MNKPLRQFLDSLSDWVWEMDIGGVHTYSNGAVKDILGYESEELIGKHVSMFWPEDSATDMLIEKFNRKLRDGEAWQYFRGRFRHKAGHLMILESSGEPLYDTTGKLIGFRGIDRDISQTIKFEDELEVSKQKYKELSERLGDANSMKELLLDIITHDLKNPIGVIYGLSEMAKEDLPKNELIDNIFLSSERLLAVLADTTILSQATFGEDIPKQELVLNQIMEEIVGDFSSALTTAEIKVEVDIPQNTVIYANPLIGEVFKNYIANAIKYAADGKRIVMDTVIEDQAVIVCVKDFGKTITKADREKIFEHRVQLEDGKNRGRGLGLAIVKRIALAHNGEVWVEPNTPSGNCFCLRISPKLGPATF